MDIKLKRAYETPAKSDGMRILVDRLWPRGLLAKRIELPLQADISLVHVIVGAP